MIIDPSETTPLRQRLKRVLLRLFGRSVRCEACGRELFRGVAVVHRGGVRLLGADTAVVRVEFASQSHIVLRHVQLAECLPR